MSDPFWCSEAAGCILILGDIAIIEVPPHLNAPIGWWRVKVLKERAEAPRYLVEIIDALPHQVELDIRYAAAGCKLWPGSCVRLFKSIDTERAETARACARANTLLDALKAIGAGIGTRSP